MRNKFWWFCGLLWLALALGVGTAAADTTYTIQRGDTLMSIGRRYGITAQAIAAANNIINPNLIYAGQVLVIPTAAQTGGTPSPTPTAAPPPAPSGTTHVVQAGERLFRIAIQYGVPLTLLAQANNISNYNIIYVGQVLVIPAVGGAPAPTAVPLPTLAPTAAVPTPQPTAVPPTVPAPSGGNLLPNGSFEQGWYHPGGVSELQIPANWRFEWDAGPTGFGTDSWDIYNRPEVRVLNRDYLPPAEHALFIWDGNQTVKVFKGSSPVSFRLLADVALAPGTYLLEVNIFPDLVMDYANGQKVWADDPLSGEVKLMAGGQNGGWILPQFGQRNTLRYQFTVYQGGTVAVGAAVRGRFAIQNNGWFLDNWSLVRVN